MSLMRGDTRWEPTLFPYGPVEIPILAPYWTDIDLRHTQSSLYYNTYSRNDGRKAQTILNIASERINNFSEEANFKGEWLLLATWDKARPYLATENDEQVRYYIIFNKIYDPCF